MLFAMTRGRLVSARWNGSFGTLVGGFLNSNIQKLCNAKFVRVGNEVFVVATKDIRKGSEVFVHYKVR